MLRFRLSAIAFCLTALFAQGCAKKSSGTIGASNEPAGFTRITENTFASKTEDGWYQDSGDFAILQDPAAPKSAPYYAEILFPAGYTAGYAPGNATRNITAANVTQLYVSFWYRQSANWYGQASNTNKLTFAWIHGTPSIFTSTEGSASGTLVPMMRLQGVPDSREYLVPNLVSGLVSTRGQWHHWEFVVVCNTSGNADGQVIFWFDGVKVGQYTDVTIAGPTQSRIFENVSWYPIWGGVGGTLPADQTEDLDDYYVSGKP